MAAPVAGSAPVADDRQPGKKLGLGNLKGDPAEKKRAYLSIGLTVVGIIVAFVLYRKQQNAAAAAAAPAAAPYSYPTMPASQGAVAGFGAPTGSSGGGSTDTGTGGGTTSVQGFPTFPTPQTPPASPTPTIPAGSGAGTPSGVGDQSSGGSSTQVGSTPPTTPTLVPNLSAILPGVSYAPPSYPGAPQVGTFTTPAFPSGAVNPYGVATPGPGGQVTLVGNTAVGSEPAWQAANNAAIAAGQPIPYKTPPV